jgi:hypothetical protein
MTKASNTQGTFVGGLERTGELGQMTYILASNKARAAHRSACARSPSIGPLVTHRADFSSSFHEPRRQGFIAG